MTDVIAQNTREREEVRPWFGELLKVGVFERAPLLDLGPFLSG
ncbi:hypothetical protein [Streptomyces sp. NPDC102462]